jgi:lipid-A-disaccharide synthase-like uncharacterized protein
MDTVLFQVYGLSITGVLVLGFVAQGIFSARFIVQWIASELRKESTIPKIFWYLSLVGGLLLLTYAILRKDPVFILGQSMGVFIYLRNIMLYKNKESSVIPKATKTKETE